jgi:hypothetical protein
MLHVNIKNKQVNEIYRRWKKIWTNKDLPLESRLKAYSILQIIEALVLIYEENEVLNEEDIDDLFIKYGEGCRLVLPEEYPRLLESLGERLQADKNLKQIAEKKKSLTEESRNKMLKAGGSLKTNHAIDAQEICREVRGK